MKKIAILIADMYQVLEVWCSSLRLHEAGIQIVRFHKVHYFPIIL